jgi:hypothetical protein
MERNTTVGLCVGISSASGVFQNTTQQLLEDIRERKISAMI